MSPDRSLLTPGEREELEYTVLATPALGEQYEDLDQQADVAALGMWVFLASEVLFFGALLTGLFAYWLYYAEAFEKASERLNWVIGGANTIVLLLSSLTMVLAVHAAKTGRNRQLITFLALTVFLGGCFLGLKGLEYYIDYQENLIPGWRFDEAEWVEREGLSPAQVPHVRLFLTFYWVATPLHALHMLIGMGAVLVLIARAARGAFSPDYYSPVDVTGLYWHFVDIVWIFLLPLLYLLGTHHL